MASTSETGHAKNAANFEELVSVCKGYGTDYNPSNTSLVITALDALLATVKTVAAELKSTTSTWITAVNDREIVFDPLSVLTTRVISALSASKANKLIVADARTIARKLKGERAGKKNNKPIDPNNPDLNPKNISVSQMSFDNRVDNFEKLIKLLAQEPEYKPNESDLAVAGLNTLLAELKVANKNVVDTEVADDKARTARNNVFYNTETGLVQTATDIKAYLKSVFGASNAKYKVAAKIRFRKYDI